MNMMQKIAMLGVTVIGLGAATGIASAADRPYTDGAVVNVSSIRTEYGKTDDYLKFLAGPWRKQMEAAKKAGMIVSYEVFLAEPKGPDDPDVYLITTYKNWAALDGLGEKMDALEEQIYGSTTAVAQGAADRVKIRRVLGSQTIQAIQFK